MVRTLDGIALEVGGTADHVHLLVRLRATHRLADVLREIKSESSRWVHDTIGAHLFAWQTVGLSVLERIRRYIANQEAHHRTVTFKEEYVRLLEEHGVEYDERYLW